LSQDLLVGIDTSQYAILDFHSASLSTPLSSDDRVEERGVRTLVKCHEAIAASCEQSYEGEHPLLAINHVVAAVSVAECDHAPDEVLASTPFLMCLEEVVEELRDFALLPDVRSLELRNDVVFLEDVVQGVRTRLLDYATLSHLSVLPNVLHQRAGHVPTRVS
jgi:hypothetical protein